MSGGVDSSVAAALLLEQGYQCVGVTLRLFKKEIDKQNSLEQISCSGLNDAKNVASSLGIDHHVLDFSEEFEKHVIRHFVETYEQGATPNPCIECNRNIKFNMLLLRARQFDFDVLATGHYAQITQDTVSGRFLLQKALDDKKDQSYVLYSLTQQQLQKIRFPLGGLSKNDVRKIADERKLVNASKEESQDICFIPDGNYSNFAERSFSNRQEPLNLLVNSGEETQRLTGSFRRVLAFRYMYPPGKFQEVS